MRLYWATGTGPSTVAGMLRIGMLLCRDRLRATTRSRKILVRNAFYPFEMRFEMLRKLLLAAGLMVSLLVPAYAADPQTFKTEESATAFCKKGNVVWYNSNSKIYFESGSQFYGKTKAGGYT